MVTIDFGRIGPIDMRNMANVWAKVFGNDFLANFDGHYPALPLRNTTHQVGQYQLDTNDGVDGFDGNSGAAVWFFGYNFTYQSLGTPFGGTVTDVQVYNAKDVDNDFDTWRVRISGLNSYFGAIPVDSGIEASYGAVYSKNLDSLLVDQTLDVDQALRILGHVYNDYLIGGDLGDKLYGYGGTDTLKGKAGNDQLFGGGGADQLGGGGGADKFGFDVALDGVKDTIQDFSHAENDKIMLDDDIFTRFAGLTAIGGARFDVVGDAHVQDSNDYIVYNPDTGVLSYDANGSGAGAGIQFATLTGHPTLVAGDFVVVA